MAQANAPQLPKSERQRVLQQLAFTASSVMSRDLPRDTVLKHLQLRLSGSVITTYASGTPVADAQSTFDNLINRIDIIVDGNRVVKSVRPIFMAIQQLFTTIVRGERRSSAAATAALDNMALADGAFTYGTTAQLTTVSDSILVSFENVYARAGREATWLNLKGRASAEVKLTTGAFANLLGFGNTAPVVYTGNLLVVDIVTIEAQDVPAEYVFSDWKQTNKELTFSAQTTDYSIDINRGNRLQAIFLFVKDGAAGSATTATGKLATNLGVTKIALVKNGQEIIKATTFAQLQSENRNVYGVDAKFTTSVSVLDGFARLDLVSRGDLSTALDCRPGVADNIQLILSTNTSTNVSYTNPVSVSVMTEELDMPR